MKSSLNTQTGKLFIVIRKNKFIGLNKIRSYCETYGKEYAFITHSNDVDTVTGVVIPIHYHIVMNAKDTKKRLSTHLNDLVEFFGFDNANGVEIDKYRTYESAIQYLIHKNDKSKTQHDIEEIVTNINSDELKTLISIDTFTISFDLVYSLCQTSNNIIEVIRSLGLSNYQKYRATIWDIWNNINK